jgi:hypothetical protein
MTEDADLREDIDRTKKRQTEIANYSALTSGGLISLVKLFSDSDIDSVVFYNVIVWASISNAIGTTWFQLLLIGSLQDFRRQMHNLPGRKFSQTLTEKFWRDLPLFLFLLAMPLAAAGFAIWYAVAMSGVPWGLG